MGILKETKKKYEAPLTERTRVEVEGTFCSSAGIQNPNTDTGRIDAHEVNQDFGYSFDNNGWDETTTN